MLSAINFGYWILSSFNLNKRYVRRTSDFLGSLSDLLVEPAATLVLTEVSVCLIEPAAMLPVTEVTLPRRPACFQHASLCLPRQWKHLLYNSQAWDSPGKLSFTAVAKLGEMLSLNFSSSCDRMWNHIL